MNIGIYAKSIVMIISAGIGILVAALSDNLVSATEYTNIGIAIVTAVGVYLVPNLSAGAAKFAKSIVAFGGAALTALVVVLGNTVGFLDVSSSDWLAVLLAGLAAIGLYIVPNQDKSGR
jgi:hypothetical protein